MVTAATSGIGGGRRILNLANNILAYLKALVAKLKEEKGWDDARLEDFKKKVQNYFMKSIKPNFKDLDVYTGSSMMPEGMYVLYAQVPYILVRQSLIALCRLVYLNYREDGVTPYFIIWKHGLSEEKV